MLLVGFLFWRDKVSETRLEIIDRLIKQFDGEWQSGRDVMYIGEGYEYLTKHEFYERAQQIARCDKMRWYDYEKKIGFIFPPAGEKVQFARFTHPWTNGEVIGMSSYGACVIEHIGGWAAIAREDDIRPMDWDKNDGYAELLSLVSNAVCNRKDGENAIAVIAAAILAAGYRKCDKDKS